jgi:hypothetical protein
MLVLSYILPYIQEGFAKEEKGNIQCVCRNRKHAKQVSACMRPLIGRVLRRRYLVQGTYNSRSPPGKGKHPL